MPKNRIVVIDINIKKIFCICLCLWSHRNNYFVSAGSSFTVITFIYISKKYAVAYVYSNRPHTTPNLSNSFQHKTWSRDKNTHFRIYDINRM